jgi:hypothetical protein
MKETKKGKETTKIPEVYAYMFSEPVTPHPSDSRRIACVTPPWGDTYPAQYASIFLRTYPEGVDVPLKTQTAPLAGVRFNPNHPSGFEFQYDFYQVGTLRTLPGAGNMPAC